MSFDENESLDKGGNSQWKPTLIPQRPGYHATFYGLMNEWCVRWPSGVMYMRKA